MREVGSCSSVVVSFCKKLKRYPRHLVIGPGKADLWNLEESYDDWTYAAVAEMKNNNINIVNPSEIYR